MSGAAAAESGLAAPTLLRQQMGLALGALLAVTALAYGGTLFAGFVWDDAEWVLAAARRPPAQAFWESMQRKAVGSGLTFNYYRPLVVSSFALDGWLWGVGPAGFHLTNLLLYLGCVTLSYLLAHRLLGSRAAALVAAAVFALHPVHVEVVAWVVARADLLAFAGAAAALLAFATASEQGPSWPRLAGAGLAFLAALLAKEAALVVPGLAAACWACAPAGRRVPPRRAAWALAPLVVSLGVYAALRAAAVAPGAPAPDRVDPQGRWLLAPVLFAKYVGLLVWPHPLNAYYELPIPTSAWDPRVLTGLGLLGATLATTAWALRRRPRLALALAWFLLGIAPVLQLVPLKGFMMAERYLFLPSFGFALAVGLAGEAVWRRAATRPARWAWGGCAALLAMAWLALVMARVPDWVEKVAFYRAMVRTAPESAYAHTNLGQILVNEGLADEGIQLLERAVSLEPSMAEAQVRLGLAYWKQGDLARAMAPLEAAARLRPRDPDIQRAWAIALGAQGRFREAVTVLHALEALQPGSAEVARWLAATYAAIGDSGRAEMYAARANALANGAPQKGKASP